MRGTWSIRSLSALVFVSALAACGGGVAIEDLDEELVDALCERAARCGIYASKDECKAYAEASTAETEHSIEAGRASYDEDKAEACLDALRGASCDRTDQSNRAEVQACIDAIAGKVADGGVCFDDEECVSGGCNVPSCEMACCMGTCNPTVAVPAIGMACQGDCVAGAYCDEGTAICVALRPAGSGCGSTFECGYGLYCGAGQVCADAPARGEACANGFCGGVGDRCDDTSRTCVGLSARGGPCRAGFAGSFDCQQPLVCDPVALTCGDRPAIGQPCTGSCAAGAFCGTTMPRTCEAERANGAACTSDSQCASDYCDQTLGAPVCGVAPLCG